MTTHATVGQFDLVEDLARGHPAPHLLVEQLRRRPAPRLGRKPPRYVRQSLMEAIRGTGRRPTGSRVPTGEAFRRSIFG